jgi:hypothetical protein
MNYGFAHLTFRVCTNPLDAERAFWHAATGTPYEPEYREQDWRFDKYAFGGRLYTLPPVAAKVLREGSWDLYD